MKDATKNLCAVCEIEIEPARAITVEQDERTFYLCGERCLAELDENPELYADWDEIEERRSA